MKTINNKSNQGRLVFFIISSALFWSTPVSILLINLFTPINYHFLPSILNNNNIVIISNIIIAIHYIAVLALTLIMGIRMVKHKSSIKVLYLILVIFQTAFVFLVLLTFVLFPFIVVII